MKLSTAREIQTINDEMIILERRIQVLNTLKKANKRDEQEIENCLSYLEDEYYDVFSRERVIKALEVLDR
jgi:hypothetical protein